MSMDMASERVGYVHCNFCNTILAVNVPGNSLYTVVTVRCGHCSNLLSVNMGASLLTASLQDPQKLQLASGENKSKGYGGSSSKCDMNSPIFEPPEEEIEAPRLLPIPPPEKRQRVPSAYNKFIKEEIQRIKANNPDITHREAFSAAAKNWAHFPHIHFGMRLDGGNIRPNQSFAGEVTQKLNGLYQIE